MDLYLWQQKTLPQNFLNELETERKGLGLRNGNRGKRERDLGLEPSPPFIPHVLFNQVSKRIGIGIGIIYFPINTLIQLNYSDMIMMIVCTCGLEK